MVKIYNFHNDSPVKKESTPKKRDLTKTVSIGFFFLSTIILFWGLNQHIFGTWAMWLLLFFGINIIGCLTVLLVILIEKNKK